MLDFLGVGAPRSGTTSLHALLVRHPEVSLPPGKELLEPALGAWERFHALIAAYGRPGTRVGLFAPQFWTEPHLPRAFRKHFPELKLIVCLRDPVERVWSAYRMRWRRGWERRSFEAFVAAGLDPEALARACSKSFLLEGGDPAPHVVLGSRYAEMLSRWEAFFPPEQIHVLILEELVRHPERELERLAAFLGLKRPLDLSLPRENTTDPGRGQTLARLVYAVHRRWLVGLPRRLPPRAALAYNALLFRASSTLRVRPDPPPPDPGVLARLRAFYRDDLLRLRQRLGRPLPWKSVP